MVVELSRTFCQVQNKHYLPDWA